MPNIDVSQIAGFDGMTAEQKIEALLKVKIPESIDLSNYVTKETFDKKATEAANLSKQLKDRMTDEEKAKAKQDEDAAAAAEANQKLLDRIAELEKDKTISDNKARFIGMGWDEALAAETAKAMADGDTEKVFANQKKFQESYEKKLKADLLKGTPQPGGTGKEEDPKETEGMKLAQKIGKAKAEANQATNDVMKHYIK